MPIVKVFGIIFFSYVLGKTTDHLIKYLMNFTRVFRIGQFEATAVIVALATSLPEIMVSVTSSLNGLSELALGNAIGSNVVNLSLVVGITAVAGRSLHFRGNKAIKKKFAPIAYTLIPFLMLWDGQLSKFDGIILILIYLIYISGLMKNGIKGKKGEKALRRQGVVSVTVLKMFFWIGLMLLSSQVIVYLAKGLALDFGLPVMFVGLFMVSVGTSLPELIFNVKAAVKRRVSMSMGNIVGSCVANSTLVIGLSAIIMPITIEGGVYQVVLPGVEYLFIVILMLLFVWSKHRLEWWEGLVLVVLFFYYTVVGVAIY